MQDPAYELRRIHLRNCLKRGVGDAPSVDLGGTRRQNAVSEGSKATFAGPSESFQTVSRNRPKRVEGAAV
jgi:hypothetical protein